MTGRGAAPKKTVPEDLRRVTHSEVLDIPQDLLTPVVEASFNEEDRPEIMKHLRECLSESSGKHWRRIHAALVLTEALLKGGSSALLSETAEGRHFDLVQRLSFLEHFDYSDKRVMNSIRKKAAALRKEAVTSLENAANRESEDYKDSSSTCSPGEASTSTAPSSGGCPSESQSNDDEAANTDAVEPIQRIMILNDVVRVGHSDDTTSESEAEEGTVRAAVRYREQRKMTTRQRNERSQLGQGVKSECKGATANASTAVGDLLGL